MKKAITLGLVVVFAGTVLMGCGGSKPAGKYGDAKMLIGKMTVSINSLTASLEKAGGAKDVAKAFTAFTASMKDLKPKIKEMEGKYPELKDKKNPPAELKMEMKGLEDASKKMLPVLFKTVKYQKDPEVAAAMKEMKNAWK